jgi:RNA polymerase sigma-70 factor (ECF subfamily)
VGVWLLKIAVNLARDHRRSRLREFWHRLSSSFEDVADLEQRLPDPHASQERVLLGREGWPRSGRQLKGSLPSSGRSSCCALSRE